MIDTSKFNSLLDVINTFAEEQTCIDHLTELRWNGNVVSPFDSTSKVYVCKGTKYKCKNTGKYFNVRTQTLFDNTKIKLQKWFLAIYLVTSHKKGISSIQLSKDIAVTQKTAWFMLQRIRACFGIDDNHTLDGVVQVDETYVGGDIKNKSNKVRMERSKGKKQTGFQHKTPVLGMLNDEGVMAKTMVHASKKEILPLIHKYIKKTATVVTDGFGAYRTLPKTHKEHVVVDHGKQIFAVGKFHTNSLEGFWSHFKRSVFGIYHHVIVKHMDKYLNESSFRYNTRLANEDERMNMLFSRTEVRTSYKSLING